MSLDKNNYKKTNQDLYNELKKIAEDNNGKLLDKEWVGAKEKYHFESSKGEFFEMYGSVIKHYGWPKDINKFLKMRASRNKTSETFLKVMKDMAELNNYKLITNDWKGHKYKYKFKSNNKPLLTVSYRYLIENGWPKNIEEYIYLSTRNNMSDEERLEEIRQIALKKGGKLISDKWLGSKNEHEFQDEYGNNFFCSPLNIKNGQWSPDRGLICEPICRQVMDHLFQTKFVKTNNVLTPKITGRSKALELDGYSEELKIAFEYQGHPAHWNINYKNYKYTIQKDIIKKEYCNKLGILLIQIERFENNITKKLDTKKILDHILKNIENTYKELNLKTPFLNKQNLIIDTSQIHYGASMLNRLSEIAKNNNSILLSKKWNGIDNKYIFQKDNTIFEISWNYLCQTGWPKDVINFSKRSQLKKQTPEENMEKLRKIAHENKGLLLTDAWKGTKYFYLFQFQDGRKFKATSNQLNQNGWPKNLDAYFNKSNAKKTKDNEKFLMELKDIALANEGTLLDTQWKGNRSTYRFLFKDGREFSMLASNMKAQGWPKDPDAFLKKSVAHKKTPEERMNELNCIAKKNNGKVISENWLGTEKPHILEFSDGRQFKMSLEKLKNNGWPQNPDQYLKNSHSRSKTLNKDELFKNFKEMISVKLDGQLLEDKWIGSKIKSSILLKDGNVISMSPDRLKSLKKL